MRYIRFFFNRLMDASVANEMIVNVKMVVVMLYKWFHDHAHVQRVQANHGDYFSGDILMEDMRIDDGDAHEAEFKKGMLRESRTGSESQVDVYLDDSCLESDKNFDTLSLWKGNSGKYPVLSELARHVLAVPVSTVSSESTFNTGGRILDAFRNSFSPATVEALICSQNWLRSAVMNLDVKQEIYMVAFIEELSYELAGVVRMD